MPNNLMIKGVESLCGTCLYNNKCQSRNDRMFNCSGHTTELDQARNIQRRDDLLFIIKTKQGARIYIGNINDHIFNPQPFTGNSLTNYNLGERGRVMDDLLILLEVLDLDTYTDLVIYLNNIIIRGV